MCDFWWRERLNKMTRPQIVTLMEGNGFACYEQETEDELREALAYNLEDGTIDPSDLPTEFNQ